MELAEARQGEAREQLQRRLRRVFIAFAGLIFVVIGVSSYLLFQQNKELEQVSNQIIRAYNELGSFIDLSGEDKPKNEQADVHESAEQISRC